MTCTALLDVYFIATDLARLRRYVADCARLAGLAEPRRSEFVLAVHEVAGNAVQHGGGRGRIRLLYADGVLRGEVTDDGPGLTGEAIPAVPPDPGSGESGRGLWLVRELSDRLRIGRGPETPETPGNPGGAIVTLEFELTEEPGDGAPSPAAPPRAARDHLLAQ